MNRAVVIKKFGNPVIADAITDGMKNALVGQEIEVVECEIDRQKILPELVRVAVGNTNTPEDYENMVTKARCDHSMRTHGRLYNGILGVWALLWLVVFEIYDYFSQWNRES